MHVTSNFTEKVNHIIDNNAGIIELKSDVAELKKGVAELKGDVAELKTGQAKMLFEMEDLKGKVDVIFEGMLVVLQDRKQHEQRAVALGAVEQKCDVAFHAIKDHIANKSIHRS